MKKELRIKVWNKYNKHCAYCGKELEYKNMQVDHLIPVFHTWSADYLKRMNKTRTEFGTYQPPIIRGTNNFNNLMPSCRRCNYNKATLSLEKFRKVIAHKIIQLNNDYVYKMAKDYRLVEETKNKVVFYFEK